MTSRFTKPAMVAIASTLVFAFPSFAEEFSVIAPNETALSVADGLVTARLSAEGCAAGFEAACSETRQRIEYQSVTAHGHGDRVAYRWEINVAETLSFNATDSHLYATRFVTPDGKDVIKFYVGSDYGYEVNRKTCFGPETFGQWHQVEVRVAWDSTKKKNLKDKTPGEVQILCDGAEVFSAAGRPNIKPEDTIHLALGLEGALQLADGDDVSVSFRNIEVGSW